VTFDEALPRVVAVSGFSPQDIRDLMACQPDELEALVATYEAQSPAGANVWAEILAVLGVVVTAATAVSGVAGAITAVNALRAL